MSLSFFNLLKLDYWFRQPYIAHGAVKWIWVVLFLALVLAGLIARIFYSVQKEKSIRELIRRFSNLGLTTGLLGLVWLFFRQENVPFLAWRFWLLGLAVIAVVWLGKLLWYVFRRLPAIREEQKQREVMNKYLPK
ncbi:MAG: hypothetical protein WCT40_03010 [Candidatus Magasanikbacteria bacterium]|jgi:hypothetical protein